MSAKLYLLGDLLRNVATGYVEPPRPTDDTRTAERLRNQMAACQSVLTSIVGPGDLLASSIRCKIAREAYSCLANCKGCKSVRSRRLEPGADFEAFNRNDIEHEYATSGPFRDIVHAISNLQGNLNEAFFEKVVERMKEVSATNETKSEKSDDDYKAMAVELCLVVALCSGVRAFYKASGMDCPSLPATPDPPIAAHFESVSDYSTKPLVANKKIAWGPTLPPHQIRKDVIRKFDLDMILYNDTADPQGPTGKASSVPTTCMEFLRFMGVMYVHLPDFLRFFAVPGQDRHLNRGQVEVVTAAYTQSVACRF
jgi:hypothetical protein